jgi:hypothetical protein
MVFLLCLVVMASCTEEIVMDVPQGRRVPVIEGSITDECKRHEVTLSTSSALYDTTGREMISHA